MSNFVNLSRERIELVFAGLLFGSAAALVLAGVLAMTLGG
jgi:hypothetical protein